MIIIPFVSKAWTIKKYNHSTRYESIEKNSLKRQQQIRLKENNQKGIETI